MRSTTLARLAMCRAAIVGMSRPAQITRRLMKKFSPSTPVDAQDTVSVLPPGELTCAGLRQPGHVRPISMCQTCLRWQSADIPGPKLTPTGIPMTTTVWCKLRIPT